MGRDRPAGFGEGEVALELFIGSSLSRSLARHFRRRYLGSGLDAPNRLNFDGQSLGVVDRAIGEMALKAFLNLSEEQTDAGVKEARTEGPRFAILKERAWSREAS